ncbi:hypothetical protein Ahy_A10g047259 [Arachis hypogaea]|uniref:SWIM-type domain-containing protein n=1 Tax=Arachis hypogaea TaxID=3818 RepID=A0A445B252_ARAHY|nr:hypothetical protein Ahy_A10g047259 [Arachis hypogaea]
MYVMLDREKECWVVFRVKLRHSHPCSAEKVVHYHEYQELTMHAKHGLPFASFVGVNHHGKSTLLSCALLGSEEIPSFEWVFTQWVRCIWQIMKKTQFKLGGYARYGELSAMMNHIVYNSPSSESFEVDWAAFIKEFALGQNRWLADSKGAIPCIGSTGIERQFQQEYTSNMFQTLQLESRCECNKFESVGILCCHILAVWLYYRVDTVPSCYILPRCSKNFIRKHTYIKSSHDVARSNESHNLFRHLCSKFYNVAQEFVACEEKAAIL